jgi:hypothetical protein
MRRSLHQLCRKGESGQPQKAAPSSSGLTGSGDGFSVKIAEAGGEQQHIEEHQSGKHCPSWEMRELGHHGAAQAFARIYQGIDQHGFLQDGELF